MKNLLYTFSILIICSASNRAISHPLFHSLSIFPNRSVHLEFINENSNNGNNSVALKTMLDVKDFHKILKILNKNELDLFNFTYPVEFNYQSFSESEQENIKSLKNEERLPRSDEKPISISRTKRNLDNLEKKDLLQIVPETLILLGRRIKDIVKAALSEVLLEILEECTSSENQFIIDKISKILNQSFHLLNLSSDLGYVANILDNTFESQETLNSKLKKLYNQAEILYEEISARKLFLKGDRNKEEIFKTGSIFDGLDELNEKLLREDKYNKEQKAEKLFALNGKPYSTLRYKIPDFYEINKNELKPFRSRYKTTRWTHSQVIRPNLRKLETSSISVSGNGMKLNSKQLDIISDKKYSNLIDRNGELTKEDDLRETGVNQKNIKNNFDSFSKLKSLPSKIYDSSATTIPFEIATDLDINAINADGIPKNFKGSLAEVHGLPKLVKKNLNVTGTQDTETITNLVKEENVNVSRNFTSSRSLMNNLENDRKILKERKRQISFSEPDSNYPVQRGMFENFEGKKSESNLKNSGDSIKNESVIEVIVEAIDKVFPPSRGEID